MEADAAKQVLEVFQNLLPSMSDATKRPWEEDKEQDLHADADSHARQKKPRSASPKKGGHKSHGMDQLTVQMSRLILRHEDALNRLKLDMGYALHIETSAPILASLLKVSRKWKGDKEAGKLVVDLPLRTLLVTLYFRELLNCIKKMSTYLVESAEFKKLVDNNVITQDKFFYKTRWDPKDKDLINFSQSMSMTELLPRLEAFVQWLPVPFLVHRFHATRPLAEHYTGKSICFLLELSMRADHSTEAFHLLAEMAETTILDVMQSRLRRSTLQRSPLATELQKQLPG